MESKAGVEKRILFDKEQQTLEKYTLKERVKDLTSKILSKLPINRK